MAADRERPTLADYVVTGISPALIMLMVGSLVFFLVEVLYAGKYSERLLYTLFFFVLGAVLVARIAIQIDAGRATAYGIALGVVVYIALLAYVDYPGGGWLRSYGPIVNLGLMCLIWWSAHKLTWDCTHLDEKQQASGRGVLAAAGLDADARDSSEPVSRDAERSGDEPKRGKKKRKKSESALWAWIARYQKHREKQKNKPHTPGVWVIYFALAALPLFALGQSLVDPDDGDRRRATFLQMAVYVASALGLLVTTSLLGVRRYLRQRKAKVPAAMTASWLGLGAVLIVVFLVLGAFLPRPHSEVPWFGIAKAGKSDREASRYAQLKDGAGKGEGADGNTTQAGDGKASGKGGQPGGSKGEKGSGGKGQDGKGGGGKEGKGGGGKDGKGNSGGKSGDKNSSDSGSSQDKSEDKDSGGDTDREGRDADGKAGGNDRSASGKMPETQVGAALQKVTGVLKWVIFAVVAVLIIGAIFLFVLKGLAPFTAWAQRLLDAIRAWWAGLFGGKTTRTREREAFSQPVGPLRPPPFSEFSNPFADGSADDRDPEELVAYTFAALDSWAWDRDLGRGEMETPLEFAARLGEASPELKPTFHRLAVLYVRAAYSHRPLPDDTRAVLEQVWDELIHGVAAEVG